MSLINPIVNFLRFNQLNWKAVALCILAAMVFWFFNALNKNYTANINFPVVFDYDKEQYVPVQQLPQQVRLNVNGMGWNLLRKSSGLKVLPLIIPLERPGEVKKIVGSTLPPLFAPQLGDLQINFVLTDTMYVEIDMKVRRKFALRIDSVEQFLSETYGVASAIRILPDSIWLEGPKSIIGSYPSTIPIPLPTHQIDESFNDEVEVNVSSTRVSRNPSVVQVTFEVDQLAEVTDTIPLRVINLPGRARPQIEVQEIAFTYQVPVSLKGKINPDSLMAVVDLKTFTGGSVKLIPNIEGLNNFSRITKVDTVKVNF